MSTYLQRTKALAAAALLAIAVAFGLASAPQAFANELTGGGSAQLGAVTTQEDAIEDGTYDAVGLTSSLGMYHFKDPQVVVSGDEAWLITTTDDDSTYKRYDGMAYGKFTEIIDRTDETNKTLVAGVPVADTVLEYASDGVTVAGRTFVLPVPKSVIESAGEIYYTIKYTAGYNDDHDGDWYTSRSGFGGTPYYFYGYSLTKRSDSTMLPTGIKFAITNNVGKMFTVDTDQEALLQGIDDAETLSIPMKSTTAYTNAYIGSLAEAQLAGDSIALSGDNVFLFPSATFENGTAAFVCFKSNKGWYERRLTLERKQKIVVFDKSEADYTQVNEAKASVPTDLSLYTEETANAVTAAVEAVATGKPASQQAEVDAMAKAIEDATAALITLVEQAATDKAAAEEAKAEADDAKAAYEAAAAKAAESGTAADAAAAAEAAATYEAAAKAAQEAAAKAVESAKAEGSGVSAEDITALETAASEAQAAAETAATAAETAKTTAETKANEEKAAAKAAAKNANLANATVTVAGATYTGKALSPAVTVKSADGKTLKAGTDYTVAYKNNVNAGKATATVTGKGSYTGSKSATFTIAKAKSTLSIKAKKKTQTIKAGKALKAAKLYKVAKNVSKGKVTYEPVKVPKAARKYIKVAKNGKITLKKGIKKGKAYTIKIKATSKATANYEAATCKITLKVKAK